MQSLVRLDWLSLITPGMSAAEILVHAVVVYFGLCLLLRVIPKRQAGRSSISDLLFVVLLGEIAGDAIGHQARSLADFLLVLLAVMLLGWAVDWLAFRYRWVDRLVQDRPTCLIRDGRIIRANMRRELVTEDELMSQLRRQDIDDPGKVKEAHLEADGEISVIKREDGAGPGRPTTSPERGAPPGDGDGERGQAGAGGAVAPGAVPCSVCRTEGGADAGRSVDEPTDRDDRSGESDCDMDPEVREFLAAAEKLRAKLDWHQREAARCKEALVRHGVRVRPHRAAP